MTQIRIHAERPEPQIIERARAWLRNDGVAVVPTDTVYALAADPASARAVRRIFEIKGRDADAALPLIAASVEQLEGWAGVHLGGVTRRLANAFWPGPLSLIIDAPAGIAPEVHGGTGTLAVRVPNHPVARALCAAWGSPLTATSANVSGRPAHADIAQLDLPETALVLVLDAGVLVGGPPSTIVDARGESPVLVRAGAISWGRVLKCLQA